MKLFDSYFGLMLKILVGTCAIGLVYMIASALTPKPRTTVGVLPHASRQVSLPFASKPSLNLKGTSNPKTPKATEPAASFTTPAPTPVATGPQSSGEQLFTVNCAPCHQVGGAGLPGIAPSIRNRDFLAIASDEFILNTVRKGRLGTAMAPRPDLSEEAIRNIITYLRSVPVTNVITVKVDDSLKFAGNAKAGADIYLRYCSSCHGPNGEGYTVGVPGPGIGLPGFLNTVSDDYIFQTLKQGRIGTPMQPFLGARGLANLSETDAHDVIAHLHELGKHNAAISASPVAEAGDAKRGRMQFDANCVACHQPGGVGKVGFAPSIRNRDFLAIASDDFIRTTIQKGRLGTAMVPRADLSAQVVNDIIAYLRDLPIENPIELKIDSSLRFNGDAQKGALKYASFCATCHGPQGEGYMAGVPGPGIGLPGFLDVASDDYILKTIQHGRVGTPMRSFIGARGIANLTEEDAYDIIAQLRVMGKNHGGGQ